MKLVLSLCFCIFPLINGDVETINGDPTDGAKLFKSSKVQFRQNTKPEFRSCSSYKPTVEEEKPQGTSVIKVEATDPDEITYSLVEPSVNSRSNFHINNKTGEIFTSRQFNRDAPERDTNFYVTVIAEDNGRPPLAEFCTFTVVVTDINDNKPFFNDLEYNVQVSEDLPKLSEVVRVVAYDDDDGENARLTYSFSGPTGLDALENYFTIDQNTGVIYSNADFHGKRNKRYTSSIRVRDNGKPSHEDTKEISITIVDSGKKAPSFFNFEHTISLKENFADFDKPLFNLTANSNIEDQSLVFELVKGKTAQTNKERTFVLSPVGETGNTAVIKLAGRLKYEIVNEYQLTIRAENKDQLDTSVNIMIKVEDVNDEIPIFIDNVKGSVVENNEPGVSAMQVRAIDKDGTSPNNQVVYELVNQKEYFDIDPNTGVITAKVPFDREKHMPPVFHVTVQARDSADSALSSERRPNSVNQTFSISIEDQNDNQPKFQKAYYEVPDVSEKTDLQKDVVEVKADDPDTASHLIYSIIEGNIGDAFNIEERTGRIRVNNKLDFEVTEIYNLTVKVDDGLHSDTAKVVIRILNENDEKPQFYPDYVNRTYMREEETSIDCITTLKAYDPDIKDRSADQRIVYSIKDNDFASISATGCVSVIKPLDRDRPNGSPEHQVHVYAIDDNEGPNSQFQLAELIIILDDINDNAPFLKTTEVVWYENQPPGHIMTLEADDYDSDKNGPPFSFKLSSSAGDMLNMFEIERIQLNVTQLKATATFDREAKKFYDLPIDITDSGTPPMTGTSILRVIIGDRNDNAAQDGESEIFVYQYEGFVTDTVIGRVYVEDPDDWDLPDKIFQLEEPSDYFNVLNNGTIIMEPTAQPKVHVLRFNVQETLPDGTLNRVNAVVTVTVKPIPKEAVIKSGSIRLKGVTAEEFIEEDSSGRSKQDKLREYLHKALNTSSVDNVDVFTVMTSPSNSSYVDVRFSAHGSPYYAPERLNNKAAEHEVELERELGVTFVMVSINECLNQTSCPKSSSCSNVLSIKGEPAAVFTNKTSFVGVKAIAEAKCDCVERVVTECFNGGTPNNNKCICPAGFEGPNCEMLGIGFLGNGWAMYPSLDFCNNTRIHLNVLPQADDGLIFFAGPLTPRHALVSQDFISLEMKGGQVEFKAAHGGVVDAFVAKSKKINDGATHQIRITYSLADVLIEIDDSSSDSLTWKDFRTKDILRVNGPLQIGGRSNLFAEEESKQTWSNPPTNRGFRGCVTNFTYNSYVYNLGAPSDKHNIADSCDIGTFEAATFGIDSNFLVAILVCVAILLILLLAVVVHKRKQDNLNEKEMDDTRANIINYEDEGGGECDANFDMSVLRNVDEKPPMKDGLYKQADTPADIGNFLDEKKDTCDKDTLPYDNVRHYAYEGDGNSTGSLSSLASCTDEGDLKFDHLSNFGPRFRKLADMYGDDASEESI